MNKKKQGFIPAYPYSGMINIVCAYSIMINNYKYFLINNYK